MFLNKNNLGLKEVEKETCKTFPAHQLGVLTNSKAGAWVVGGIFLCCCFEPVAFC